MQEVREIAWKHEARTRCSGSHRDRILISPVRSPACCRYFPSHRSCGYTDLSKEMSAARRSEAGMSSQPKPISRRWRLYPRFSVRGLIVLVLLIGGWFGWIARSARIQRDAVAAIEHENGYVLYQCDWKNEKPLRYSARPWYLKWLEKHVGRNYFSNVVSANFSEGPSDAKLALVSSFYQLEELQFDTPLTTGGTPR